jgi:hypothetical protein
MNTPLVKSEKLLYKIEITNRLAGSVVSTYYTEDKEEADRIVEDHKIRSFNKYVSVYQTDVEWQTCT